MNGFEHYTIYLYAINDIVEVDFIYLLQQDSGDKYTYTKTLTCSWT